MLYEMPPGTQGTPGAAGKDGKSKYLFLLILIQLKKPTEIPIPPLGAQKLIHQPL